MPGRRRPKTEVKPPASTRATTPRERDAERNVERLDALEARVDALLEGLAIHGPSVTIQALARELGPPMPSEDALTIPGVN